MLVALVLPLLVQNPAGHPYLWHANVRASTTGDTLTYAGKLYECFVTDLKNKRTWTPTGKSVDFIDFEDSFPDMSPRPPATTRKVVFKVPALDSGQDMAIRFASGSPGSGYTWSAISGPKAGRQTVFVWLDDSYKGPENIQYGFSKGGWRTIGSYNFNTGKETGVLMHPKLDWQTPGSPDGGTFAQLALRPSPEFDSKKIRVETQYVHGTSSFSDGVFGDPAKTDAFVFVNASKGSTIEQIKKGVKQFIFQERDFDWIEFKDARLSPVRIKSK
ncbi:MAG TPA: hypothetical protein VGL56_08005 [Fimbriimonadaceae bacterium]|jgi:hypothetical protein